VGHPVVDLVLDLDAGLLQRLVKQVGVTSQRVDLGVDERDREQALEIRVDQVDARVPTRFAQLPPAALAAADGVAGGATIQVPLLYRHPFRQSWVITRRVWGRTGAPTFAWADTVPDASLDSGCTSEALAAPAPNVISHVASATHAEQ
jgi:hypothetical protein